MRRRKLGYPDGETGETPSSGDGNTVEGNSEGKRSRGWKILQRKRERERDEKVRCEKVVGVVARDRC